MDADNSMQWALQQPLPPIFLEVIRKFDAEEAIDVEGGIEVVRAKVEARAEPLTLVELLLYLAFLQSEPRVVSCAQVRYVVDETARLFPRNAPKQIRTALLAQAVLTLLRSLENPEYGDSNAVLTLFNDASALTRLYCRDQHAGAVHFQMCTYLANAAFSMDEVDRGLTVFRYAENAYRCYNRSRFNPDIKATYLADVALVMGSCVRDLLKNYLVEPTTIRRQARRAIARLRTLARKLGQSRTRAHAYLILGELIIFQPTLFSAIRASKALHCWRLAAEDSAAVGDLQGKETALRAIEEYQFMAEKSPLVVPLMRQSEAELDRIHLERLFLETARHFDTAFAIASEPVARKQYLRRVADEFETDIDMVWASIYELAVNPARYDLALGTRNKDPNVLSIWEFSQWMAREAADDGTKLVTEQINASQFCQILRRCLDRGEKFAVLLRDFSVESYFEQARPRTFRFPNRVVENYKEGVGYIPLAEWADVRQDKLEALLASTNVLSIYNVQNFLVPRHATNALVLSQEQWRSVAFSLIGHAAAIVVVVPKGYCEGQSSGLLEEMEVMLRLGQQGNAIRVEIPMEGTPGRESMDFWREALFSESSHATKIIWMGEEEKRAFFRKQFPNALGSEGIAWADSIAVAGDEDLDRVEQFLRSRL